MERKKVFKVKKNRPFVSLLGHNSLIIGFFVRISLYFIKRYLGTRFI
jgi:hypothetical protein